MKEKTIESLAKIITGIIVIMAVVAFSEIVIYVTVRVIKLALER